MRSHRELHVACIALAASLSSCGRLADKNAEPHPRFGVLRASVTQADPGRPVAVARPDMDLALIWRSGSSLAAMLDRSTFRPAYPVPDSCDVREPYEPPSCSGVPAAGTAECTFTRPFEITQPVEREGGGPFAIALGNVPPPEAMYDLSAQGGRGTFAMASLRAYLDEDADGTLRYGTPGADGEPVLADSAYRDYAALDGRHRTYLLAYLDGEIALSQVRPEFAEALGSLRPGFSVLVEEEWTDSYGRPFAFAHRIASLEESIELITAPDIGLAAPWCREWVEEMRHVAAIPRGFAPLWCSEDGEAATWRSSRRTGRCTYETLMYEGDRSCSAELGSWSCPAPIGGLVEVSAVLSPSQPVVALSVSVDGRAPASLGTDGRLTVGVSAGPHVVELGVPANCSVDGQNPVLLTVANGDVESVHFRVQCITTTRLRITTVTAGARPDDAYLLTGANLSTSIGANDSILLDLGPTEQGWFTVNVGDVASNCMATDHPGEDRDVRVWLTAGQLSELLVPVRCFAPGRIRVTTTVSGTPPAFDAFLIGVTAVDAPWDQRSRTYLVSASGTVFIGDGNPDEFPAGTYRVRLGAFAENCEVSPAETTFEVAWDATSDLTFEFVCTATRLRVTTVTTGSDPDDGYVVTVAGPRVVVSSPVGADDSVLLTLGSDSRFYMYFEDVAWNCAVSRDRVCPWCGQTGQYFVVYIEAGQLEEWTIPVECTAAGRIRVTTSTSGSPTDPDGLSVVLSGGDVLHVGPWQSPLPVAGTILLGAGTAAETLPAGTYSAHLTGVSPNCDPSSAVDVTFDVPAGGTSDIAFDVQCHPPAGVRITTVVSTIDPDPDGFQLELTRVDAPGTHESVPIATNGTLTIGGLHAGTYRALLRGVAPNCDANEATIAVGWGETAEVTLEVTCSPDVPIAYVETWSTGQMDEWFPSEIVVVNSNGTGATSLTQHAAQDIEPAWSPDGKIAFTSDRGGGYDVYVMNADGSSVVQLTSGGASEPAWAPDGNRIAFVSSRDGNPEIYVMRADGSQPMRLTDDPAVDSAPAWSPDGSRIAFTRGTRLYVMNADGTGVARFRPEEDASAGPYWESDADWSPDGSRVAFTRNKAVYVALADGSAAALFTSDGTKPSWSPDGRHLAYEVCSWVGFGEGMSSYLCYGGITVARSDGTKVPVREGSPLWWTGVPAAENPAWRRAAVPPH